MAEQDKVAQQPQWPLILKGHFDAALEKAEDAFWAAFAAEFPSIKTGDFDPWNSAQFSAACRTAASIWIAENSRG